MSRHPAGFPANATGTPPSPRRPSALGWATWCLTAVATFGAEAAIAEPDAPSWLTPTKVTTALVAMTIPFLWITRRVGSDIDWELVHNQKPWQTRFTRSPQTNSSSGSGVGGTAAAWFVALAVLPLLGDLLAARIQSRGIMLEIGAIAALRNLGLALTGLAAWSLCRDAAALVSLFLALVAASLGEGAWIPPFLGAYAAIGSIWLTLAYWRQLRLASHAMKLKGRGGAGREGGRRPPVSSLVAVGAMLLALAVGLAMGPRGPAGVLFELVASSGGTGAMDEDARSGVNDGPNEVEGTESAQSTGFTQSEVYLESKQDSLYDVFNELYGEPYIPKHREIMMSLESDKVRETDSEPRENLKGGREFPLTRRKPTRSRLTDRPAEALFHLVGPIPAHVRQTAYDRFDGLTWSRSFDQTSPSPIYQVEGGPWFETVVENQPFLVGTVKHEFKIGNLKSRVVPSPGLLVAFRVGSLNRSDFFEGDLQGLVGMVRTIPPGTVVETVSHTFDPRELRRFAVPLPSHPVLRRHLELPGRPFETILDPAASTKGRSTTVLATTSQEQGAALESPGLDPRIAALAREWTRGTPRGWIQVERIVEGLQSHCRLDWEATLPDDCNDAVSHFLFESRAGPDSWFASAAAVMLRQLNYPARVVGGYYADPAHYDLRERRVSVTELDAHVWVEVLVGQRTWVTVEPTPGYQIAPPRLDLWRMARDGFFAALALANRHRLELGLGLILAALLAASRAMWLDGVRILIWRARLIEAIRRRDGRRAVWATVRLIDGRLKAAGLERPVGVTPSRWFAGVVAANPHLLADLDPVQRARLERLPSLIRSALFDPRADCLGRTAAEIEAIVAVCEAARHVFARSALNDLEAIPRRLRPRWSSSGGHASRRQILRVFSAPPLFSRGPSGPNVVRTA